MKFEPLEDRILVLPDTADEQKGLIYIPETYRKRPQLGTVIAAPTGIRNHDGDMVDPLVKVGDRILFAKYTGTEIKIEEVDYIIMREGDILGRLHGETDEKLD
jgi:chaperonin GroES